MLLPAVSSDSQQVLMEAVTCSIADCTAKLIEKEVLTAHKMGDQTSSQIRKMK